MKKILFLCPRIPFSLSTGDRVRNYNLIKALVEKGYEVDILGFHDSSSKNIKLEEIVSAITIVEDKQYGFTRKSRVKQFIQTIKAFIKKEPRRVYQYRNKEIERYFDDFISTKDYDHIHFAEMSMCYLINNIPDGSKKKIVIDFIDAISLAVKSTINQSNLFISFFRRIEVSQIINYERNLLALGVNYFVISQRDADYLLELCPNENRPKISVIPNGIVTRSIKTAEKKDIDLIFVGNMSVVPNIDAVSWFVKNVKNTEKIKELKFFIVGRDPVEKIKDFESIPNITVTGEVENVFDYLIRSKLFVCPIRSGAGMKNKILEAMQVGLAIISTDEAIYGIDVTENEICFANNPKQFVDSITQLIENDEERERLSKNALTAVNMKYKWENIYIKFADCYEGLTT